MDKLGIGILGYGGFARFLHQSWSQLDEVLVVAAADSRAEANPGDIRFYDDWQKLADDPEVAIVAIASPPSTHADLAVALMQAGKHLLVEKPVALSAKADTERLLRARDDAGVVVAVNHMLRLHPLLETFQSWVKEGTFGPLRHASVENYAQDETLPPNHWFWDRYQSGGILIEHAVHFIDLVDTLAAAPVTRVTGAAADRRSGQRDRVLASVEYEDGLIATHYHHFSGLNSFEETHIRLAFDKLRMRLHGWIPTYGHLHALVDETTYELIRSLPNWTERTIAPLDNGNVKHFAATGEPYAATHEVFGTFRMDRSKMEVYADLVRASMLDVVKAVRDASHKVRVPLEIGLSAVDVAERATSSAVTSG